MKASRSVCYGKNNLLLEIRQLVLMHAGFCMEKSSTLLELDHLAEERVDLLMLCHSLNDEDCMRAVALVQFRWPQVKILHLSPSALRTEVELRGRVVLPANGAGALVETVEKLLELPVHIQ